MSKTSCYPSVQFGFHDIFAVPSTADGIAPISNFGIVLLFVCFSCVLVSASDYSTVKNFQGTSLSCNVHYWTEAFSNFDNVDDESERRFGIPELPKAFVMNSNLLFIHVSMYKAIKNSTIRQIMTNFCQLEATGSQISPRKARVARIVDFFIVG